MDRLRQLPREKRKAVMHAAMEVFAQSDYKRASTEEIARKAGISKGLLFYYFKNKQTLYLYLARYLQSFIEQNMKIEQMAGITDFFELLDYGMEEKLAILRKLPWALEFSVRMYTTPLSGISARRCKNTRCGCWRSCGSGTSPEWIWRNSAPVCSRGRCWICWSI